MLLQLIHGWLRGSYFSGGAVWDDAQILLGRGLIVRRGGQFTPWADVAFSLRLDAS